MERRGTIYDRDGNLLEDDDIVPEWRHACGCRSPRERL
jgi:hypothetical protein